MNDQAKTPTKQAGAALPETALLPPVDVIEDSAGITLYADLPACPRISSTCTWKRTA